MKNLTYLLPCLLLGVTGFSQVGINTTNPTSTLDVNGTVRVRSLGQNIETGPELPPEHEATRIMGLDDDGNFVKVELDENIYLDNNVLKSVDRKAEIGTLPNFNAPRANNVSLIIWPGGANSGKSVIRIENLQGDIEITGFDVSGLGGPALADGTMAWLYAVDGKVKLKIDDNNSDPENQIKAYSDIEIKQYGMVQIMYDGVLQRWVVMSKKSN